MGRISGYFLMPHPPIMLPEIGRGEDEKINSTKQAASRIGQRLSELKPDTIILITPHGPVFRDAVAISQVEEIAGDFGRFGHPELQLQKEINLALTDEIIANADEDGIGIAPITSNAKTDYNIVCELDHGAMVPLSFIDKSYQNYKLVHITYGALTCYELYRFGNQIQRAVKDIDCNAVVIASGDLSHRLSNSGPYEFNPNGPIFDKEAIRLLQNGDVLGIFDLKHSLIEGAGECALRSVYILLGSLNGIRFKGELYSYEGPFGVGYAVMEYHIEQGNGIGSKQLEEHRSKSIQRTRTGESVQVRLARESLVHYLETGKYLKLPEYIPVELQKQQRGTFVSMKKGGELRGCIGTILPTTNSIAEEIMRNAVEAGLHDPRFYPVALEEIADIVFSVDVLGEPVKAEKNELDPARFGVIVTKGNRRGLLLPDLDGVDTVEQQLEIALRKGGIDADSDYEIEKFEVIRYK